ncbi:MAG TPA: hypothetical protein H9878_13345 [Candidatus Dietzia merdigallinarum]|nr:hypothetical protein [Candidatus Dietzia merdigallinarum]
MITWRELRETVLGHWCLSLTATERAAAIGEYFYGLVGELPYNGDTAVVDGIRGCLDAAPAPSRYGVTWRDDAVRLVERTMPHEDSEWDAFTPCWENAAHCALVLASGASEPGADAFLRACVDNLIETWDSAGQL